MASVSSSGVTIYGKDLEVGSKSESLKKLEDLASQTTNIIFETKNVFPFDFFPDRLIVRPTKIDIVYGMFFFSDYVLSLLIKDLKAVKLTTGIFFGSLQFELQGYEQNPPEIKFLPRHGAIRARRVIAGLMAAYQNNVDLTQLPANELSSKAEEIGMARTE